MSTCAQQRAKQQWDLEPKRNAARQKRKITTFIMTKLKNLTQLFKTPEENWRFQWNPQCHASHEKGSPPPRLRHRKLQCQKKAGETLALSEGRLSLRKRERQVKTFESQRCLRHRGRNQEDHVADLGCHSWHHDKFGAHSRANQQSHGNSNSKDCTEMKVRRHFIAQMCGKVPSLECLNFHRQMQLTHRISKCRRHKEADQSSVMVMHAT